MRTALPHARSSLRAGRDTRAGSLLGPRDRGPGPRRRRYGRQTLQGLACTGSQVSGEEARRLGLVHVSVPRPELDSAVAAALDGIRAASPGAVAATKEALNEPLLTDGVPRARRALEKLARELLFSPDGVEGMTAFRERRAPNWTARTGTLAPATKEIP
jgi:enoyl-CoA hydratase/carnithine racemase